MIGELPYFVLVRTLICLFLFSAFNGFTNTNHYSLKLDEFTLAKSSQGLNDTIDVTTAAWQSSDSLHFFLYLCGGNYDGAKCRLLARDTENKLFEMHFDNKGVAIQYSISTKKIDPKVVKLVALTMGISPTGNRLGLNYRMGFLRFV